MNIPDKFYRVSAKALVFDEHKKILLLKEAGGKGWELPGGGIEYGEAPYQTIIREVKEECGFTVGAISDNPSIVWSVKRKSSKDGSIYWCMFIGYKTTLSSMNFTPSSECEEYRFVSLDEMQSLHLHTNIQDLPKLLGPISK